MDEKTLLWRALSDFQSDAKDGFFGLAGAHVTRAKENQKVPAKVEGLNAVLVEFQRLIIDGADEGFPGARGLIQNGAGLRVFLRLREHAAAQLLARKVALAIEQGACEIFGQ